MDKQKQHIFWKLEAKKMDELMLIHINGTNPFKSIPIDERFKKQNPNTICTHMHRKFSLSYTSSEHCTTDRNFLVFENIYHDKCYYIVTFLED